MVGKKIILLTDYKVLILREDLEHIINESERRGMIELIW